MKKYKTNIQLIVNIMLVYACFYVTQGSIDIKEWQSTIPETFIFVVVVMVIFRCMRTFLK